MLPSWNKELRVVLCPDKAMLLGLNNGLHRKVTLQELLPCIPITGAPAWRPALTALDKWLGVNKIGRANVTLILSNHFVRYVLMPFSAEVASPAEEQTLAQILLEETYGGLAKQWHLKISGGGYGEPRLVAAVDEGLLEAIDSVFASGTLRLNAVRPYLMSAFNHFREQIQEKDSLFALVESGQLVLVTVKRQELAGVRRMPLSGSLNEQLPDLLLREMSLNGLEAEGMPIYLHVTEMPDFNLTPVSGMSIQILRRADKSGPALNNDARFDMACTG